MPLPPVVNPETIKSTAQLLYNKEPDHRYSLRTAPPCNNIHAAVPQNVKQEYSVGWHLDYLAS